jgi:FkbM family methyltransferase
MLEKHGIDTVVDVGANEGEYGRRLRELGFGGRIVSFEPGTAAYKRLQESARGDELWTVAPRGALGNQEGQICLNLASNGERSSSVLPMLTAHEQAAPDATYFGSEVVPITRLDRVADELLTQTRNIFLKVDVQGYELEVLQGAAELLPRIVGAQLELSFVPLYEGQTLFHPLLGYMLVCGFCIWGIMPGLVDNVTGRLLQTDVVFFRE